MEEVVNAGSWVHTIVVLDDPTTHPLVAQVVAGANCEEIKQVLWCRGLGKQMPL